MSIIGSNLLAGASGQGGAYEIERGLRFEDDDSASLNRTFGTSTNNKKSTVSFWVKRSTLGSYQTMWHGGIDSGSAGNYSGLRFNPSDVIEILDYQSAYRVRLITSQVFRDTSAWYHIVFAIDTTQSTPADRNKLYVNGEQVTSFSTQTNYSSSYDPMFNKSSTAHYIGQYKGSSNLYYFDGYMAEFNFVDGTQLDVTDFGETDEDTGAWIPKKYSGSYGTNGFYLNFSDNSTVAALGTDTSSNGNDWTPVNLSVTAGFDNDSVTSSPTNNQSTDYNLITAGTVATILDAWFWQKSSQSWNQQVPTQSLLPTSGKWWVEFGGVIGTNFSNNVVHGLVPIEDAATKTIATYPGASIGYGWYNPNQSGTSTWNDAGTTTSIGTSVPYSGSGVYKIGFAIDCDQATPTVELWQNAVNDITDTAGWTKAGDETLDRTKVDAGLIFSVSIYYGNTGPLLHSTNPTVEAAGYKMLKTANLPEPTIKNGTNYFNTVLYTGTGSTQSITGVGFQPDLVWIKKRSAAENHELQDSVRGATKRLVSNSTAAETTVATTISSFDSDGFTVVSDATTNQNTATYVAWCWRAGGSSSSNTDGSITSTVSANPTAGFSIVTWNSTGGDDSIGHGLNQQPELIFMKSRINVDGWFTWFTGFSTLEYLLLNSSSAKSTYNYIWSSLPNATTFGSSGASLQAGAAVAYCWHSVPGYSKFGSYTGNGSADGPFVMCGFRPALVVIKRTDNIGNWEMLDNQRLGYNDDNDTLRADLNNAEVARSFDILSNGFKIRQDSGLSNQNASGATYIFMAFAETPFKYANAR